MLEIPDLVKYCVFDSIAYINSDSESDEDRDSYRNADAGKLCGWCRCGAQDGPQASFARRGSAGDE